MRLIIPVIFSTPGGVERVILSVLSTIPEEAERIVLVIPKKKIRDYQSKLPDSRIIFEPLEWDEKSLTAYYLRFLEKSINIASRLKINFFNQFLKKCRGLVRLQARLQYLVQKHHATHGLYFLTNRVPLPQLNIPVGMVCHDVFWRFAPLSYSESYKQTYDKSLLSWLDYSSTVIAVSERTKADILRIFPEFEYKVAVVPNSGFKAQQAQAVLNSQETSVSIPGLTPSSSDSTHYLFYFPSSFSLYKDHLSLLQAGASLAQYNQSFKIVLTGKDTEKITRGDFSLRLQKETEEYSAYLAKLQNLYLEESEALMTYFIGLGYCEEIVVETCYQTCHCVVIPSIYEGFGLALAEAIVRGLPVICSDLDVFQEQLRLYRCEDRALIFEKGNPDSLMKCMKDFLASPIPRLEMSEVKERFGHWTWSDVSKQYIKCLSGDR